MLGLVPEGWFPRMSTEHQRCAMLFVGRCIYAAHEAGDAMSTQVIGTDVKVTGISGKASADEAGCAKGP